MPNFQDHPEAIIELSRRDLDEIVESAAARGAERALEAAGLAGADAVQDVRELRSLLEVWRDMRSTALKTFVQIAVTALIGAVVMGGLVKMGVLSVMSGAPLPK